MNCYCVSECDCSPPVTHEFVYFLLRIDCLPYVIRQIFLLTLGLKDGLDLAAVNPVMAEIGPSTRSDLSHYKAHCHWTSKAP